MLFLEAPSGPSSLGSLPASVLFLSSASQAAHCFPRVANTQKPFRVMLTLAQEPFLAGMALSTIMFSSALSLGPANLILVTNAIYLLRGRNLCLGSGGWRLRAQFSVPFLAEGTQCLVQIAVMDGQIEHVVIGHLGCGMKQFGPSSSGTMVKTEAPGLYGVGQA